MSEPAATLRKNVAESLRAAELVEAKPNLCWENASNVVLDDEFPSATYVEGAVISRYTGFPQEHGWVVFKGEIIDPTLPERELFYFPAHQWTGKAFTDVLFKYEDKPYFKHSEFKVDAVQVEMDKARAAAAALAATWG